MLSKVLADNPGKRRTEVCYLAWFAATVPCQFFVMSRLSFDSSNDVMLVTMGGVMGAGSLVLPVLFRAAEDRGKPLRELYGIRMGLFLAIWAVLGGLTGTDPWYEVLHGHFAFNTEWNPNGVPLFMLPMTIAVFGAYTVILGSLYRLLSSAASRVGGALAQDTWWRHGVIALTLAPLMPAIETLGYTSDYYCFDSAEGKWALNLLIYGAWHFAALLFYPRFDRGASETTPLGEVAAKAFATVGVLVICMAIIKSMIAPHFTDVRHGVRYVNDWSIDNCLGEKP